MDSSTFSKALLVSPGVVVRRIPAVRGPVVVGEVGLGPGLAVVVVIGICWFLLPAKTVRVAQTSGNRYSDKNIS